MNRKEIVAALAARLGCDCTIKQAEETLDAVLDTFREALASGDDVRLNGFGLLRVLVRPARTYKVPGTDRTVDKPETRYVDFNASDALDELVNAGPAPDAPDEPPPPAA